MVDQGLANKLCRAVALCAACLVICMAGCSIINRSNDDGAAAPDTELAASIVYLRGDEKPEQLNRLVQPGTVVVWLNKSEDYISIVFPERTVTIACLNPVSFNINDEGIFESKMLSPGAVASLCFIQPGLYAYSVEFLRDERTDCEEGVRLEGVIVVK